MNGKELRVVALVEAMTVTGPAKNLLRFCQRVRQPVAGPRIEMTLATFTRGTLQRHDGDFLSAAEAAGIPVDLIPEKGRFDLSVIDGLKAVIARREADILQTHAVKSSFLSHLGGLRKQCHWLAFHHGYTAEKWYVHLYNRLDGWSLPGAERVVTVCRPFAADLIARGVKPELIEVLPNAIDPYAAPAEEAVEEVRQRLALRSGEKVLVTIGRLSREKAQCNLLAAAGQLRRLEPDLRFRVVLIGDGVDRQALLEQARADGFEDWCHFAGQQKDVRPYLALADVFVLPSLSEGSPNVVLEAMAAGRPIVATAVGGVPDMVSDEESALLCPAGKVERLTAQLRRMLLEPGLAPRLIAAATRRLDDFSPNSYEQTLRGIYAKLSG